MKGINEGFFSLSRYTAIANTNEKGTPVINGNLKTTSFKTTPKMSTYLIAFVVSDFINKGKQTKNNVDVRVWARKDAIDTVDYALEVGTTDTVLTLEGFFVLLR